MIMDINEFNPKKRIDMVDRIVRKKFPLTLDETKINENPTNVLYFSENVNWNNVIKEEKPVKNTLSSSVKKEKNIFESRLPEDGSNPQFGVPEQEKYPLFDEAHVKSAIKLFGHVEPAYEYELAKSIIAKMKQYNIPFNSVGKDNKLYKYIPDALREK